MIFNRALLASRSLRILFWQKEHRVVAGLVAVTVQREVAQVPIVEPLFDDFQRGGFLAHKQDGLSVSQAFGNDVDNRLTLARSRRRGET